MDGELFLAIAARVGYVFLGMILGLYYSTYVFKKHTDCLMERMEEVQRLHNLLVEQMDELVKLRDLYPDFEE